MKPKILIIGACGQIGSELTFKLRQMYGDENIIASDISYNNAEVVNSGIFEILDAQDFKALALCIEKHKVKTVYLMAAMLSATSEKFPLKAWDLNTQSLFHVLNLAKSGVIKHIFWPSSIAVFGPTTPKENTPQHTVMEPSTVYGITKQVGERWCEYYFNRYKVDVRSLRYPGIISWKTLPGGGTTDYAVDIYHKALSDGHYECFLTANTKLPMMYMEDAISATINLMESDSKTLHIRSSYNLAAISFTPQDVAKEIQKHLPEFNISYIPDFRQGIADSWPKSIDDSQARSDWNWSHQYNLEAITKDMLTQLAPRYK
ncbi:NAD-dependent epimerase/dehydratase family protein [Formosa sp. S-31]|uniref:NAD-dependent epimerase/dehydratase family protein n=1 Tax=Formosa sp. S-31 TaxID=2790949 RepID=UPI003EB8F3F3